LFVVGFSNGKLVSRKERVGASRSRPIRPGRAPGALSHMVAANLRVRALAPVVRDTWAAGVQRRTSRAARWKLAWQKSPPFGRQARASEDVRDSSESGTIHLRPGLRGPFRFPGNLRGPEHLRKSFSVTIVFKRGKKSCAFHPESEVAGSSQSHRKTLEVRRFCGRLDPFLMPEIPKRKEGPVGGRAF